MEEAVEPQIIHPRSLLEVLKPQGENYSEACRELRVEPEKNIKFLKNHITCKEAQYEQGNAKQK